MAGNQFTLSEVLKIFELNYASERMFKSGAANFISGWLQVSLARGLKQGFENEKECSERIIQPILSEMRDLNDDGFTVYSGRNLNIGETRGVVGKSNFLLSFGDAGDEINAPIFAVLEADLSGLNHGMARCAAHMVAARIYNTEKLREIKHVYGIATSGNQWRLMSLDDEQRLTLDEQIYALNDIGELMDVIQTMIDRCRVNIKLMAKTPADPADSDA